MFERFNEGDFDITAAAKAPEPLLWGVAANSGVAGEGAPADGTRMTGGIARLDDEVLRRMSREIFRDLGVKEAAITAYFARYDNVSRRSAETA